jgi:phosphatidate phosphatase APP1
MKTVQTLQLVGIKNHQSININLSLFYSSKTLASCKRPLDGIFLFSKNLFKLNIIFKNAQNKTIDNFPCTTDNYGNLSKSFAFTLSPHLQDCFQVEIVDLASKRSLHTLRLLNLQEQNRVVICDFDKTLVATKYSNATEIINNLMTTIPDSYKIQKSIDILKKTISEGHHSFILSASPHFFAPTIKKWLERSKIPITGIFLKDFRPLLSKKLKFLTFSLFTNQVYFKIKSIINILSLTGVPKELVLIGDDYESDHEIYLWIKQILAHNIDFQFLNKWKLNSDNKLHLKNKFLKLMSDRPEQKTKVTIHIRTTKPIGKDGLDIHSINEINYFL